MAQHGGCSRAHLHEADFSDCSDRVRIVCAFDLRHGNSQLWRKTALLGFLANEPHMCEAINRVRLRQTYQVDRWRERQSREFRLRFSLETERNKACRNGADSKEYSAGHVLHPGMRFALRRAFLTTKRALSFPDQPVGTGSVHAPE